MELTRQQAARVAVHFQQLKHPRRKASPTTVLEIVRGLGNLQIDTINVVERSHHLVLYSRLDGYLHEHLDEVFVRQRKLCEYLTNVAAIIPIEDYPYYHYGWITRESSWTQQHWLPKNRDYVEQVRKAIPQSPFTTSDFPESLQRGGRGWSGSELSRALWVLVSEGSLMIHHREGARIFYARKEDEPTNLKKSEIDDQRLLRFLLRRSLSSMGLGTLREIQLARIMPAKEYRREVDTMVQDGSLELVSIRGQKEKYYILTERRQEIDAAAEEPATDGNATLLSPFDNLIINRQRTFKLFEFYPRFEAYVPKEKRKYGYYNMPILYEEKLLGYIDPKLDRRTRLMTFHTLSLNQTPTDTTFTALVEEFIRFLIFHDTQTLEVKTSEPKSIAKKIQVRVNRAIKR